jgi:hypothetical protein
MGDGLIVGWREAIEGANFEDDMQDIIDSMSGVYNYDILPETEYLVDTVGKQEEEPRREIPADEITINVYATEHQDETAIAREVERLFTLWEEQKRRVYA